MTLKVNLLFFPQPSPSLLCYAFLTSATFCTDNSHYRITTNKDAELCTSASAHFTLCTVPQCLTTLMTYTLYFL